MAHQYVTWLFCCHHCVFLKRFVLGRMVPTSVVLTPPTTEKRIPAALAAVLFIAILISVFTKNKLYG